MRMHRTLGLILAIQFGMALSAFGQGGYKTETIGAAPADIPAPLQSTLDTRGVRVTSDQGATLCEIWLRKTLPTNANPNPESDVLYGALTEGAFLGVLHFPKDASDFRSQTIKAGALHATYVRDLRGVIDREGAAIGVLISLEPPKKPMRAEAASAGFYKVSARI